MNVYGQYSLIDGFNFKNIDRPGVYGYWDHMDYIIKTAEENGIYIGMVCIWGGLVKSGLMDVSESKQYGKFLAERYKDRSGIIPSYGAYESWWDALKNPGFNQMKYLKELILKFPFFERIPDQSNSREEWREI